jgi:hypothetical protein
LDSEDRYNELPCSPPTNVPSVPASAKRKRTQRSNAPSRRKRTDTKDSQPSSNPPKQKRPQDSSGANSNGARKPPVPAVQSGLVSASRVQDTQLLAQPNLSKGGNSDASPRVSNTCPAVQAGTVTAALKSDADAAFSNEPDSAASVATGVLFAAPPGTETRSQGQVPEQKRKRVRVLKTLSPAKALQPGVATNNNNGHVQESSSLKEAMTPATARPPLSTASEASASMAASVPGNSLKRPAWPKSAAKHATASLPVPGGRKRSEVERRLECLVALGQHKVLRLDAVQDFVRLFNMCDISPPTQRDDDAHVAAGPSMVSCCLVLF